MRALEMLSGRLRAQFAPLPEPTSDWSGGLGRAAPPAPQDADILLGIDLRSERTAGYTRLAVVGSVTAVLAASAPGAGYSGYVAAVLAANLGISALELLLGARSRSRVWLSWTVGLCDVAMLLAIILVLTRFRAVLPGSFRPALIEAWAFFAVLALSALRGRPRLIVVQTLLLACGLKLAVSIPPPVVPAAEVARALSTIYGKVQNDVRVLLVLLTGIIMSLAASRARAALRDAIVGTRRAANLSRYFAPPIAEVVADAELVALRDGRQQPIAVLFADVRDFAALSDSMSPREIAGFLTEFRRLAAIAIERHGGSIDKFIGDEVMGVFGVPTPSAASAAGAVGAARSLLRSIRLWNVERAQSGLVPVAIGIGVDHGPAFVGVVGEGRLEFTVLGRTVNVAKRLEQLTKSVDEDLLVTEAALRSAQAHRRGVRHYRSIPDQDIRGCSDAVKVFAISLGRTGCGKADQRATDRP